MRRREFITLLGGAATAWPLAARAQQPAMPMIGFLASGVAEESVPLVAAFQQGLKQTNYFEGQNVATEYYWAQSQYDRVPAMAADLVARKAAVIVASSLPVALAAKTVTTTTPIVFVIGDDPVRFGLVASLNSPGGNITGVTFLSPAIEAKRVELLHELVPQADTIAVLVNPSFPSVEVRTTAVRGAASALGLKINVFNTSSAAEIETAFSSIAEHHINALLITTDPIFYSEREKLVELAARYALPTLYNYRGFTMAGGLISYGSDIPDSYRQAGIYVGRVLKGEKPADLPVEQPTKFELVINLKTAKALGLDVPAKLLALADDAIE